MPDAADKLRGQLGDPSVVVLGSAAGGRVALLVAASPGAVERGVKAGAIVKAAAQVVGGGGGGRDTMAQAGGRDPDKLPEALETARAEIARALGACAHPGDDAGGRVVALDYGSARCGVAVSDPTGTLATPLEPILRPEHAQGLQPAARRDPRAASRARVVVGLPLSLSGRDSAQTREARAFAERLGARARRARRALRRALHDRAGAAAAGVGGGGLARRRGAARGLARGPALSADRNRQSRFEPDSGDLREQPFPSARSGMDLSTPTPPPGTSNTAVPATPPPAPAGAGGASSRNDPLDAPAQADHRRLVHPHRRPGRRLEVVRARRAAVRQGGARRARALVLRRACSPAR